MFVAINGVICEGDEERTGLGAGGSEEGPAILDDLQFIM